MDRKNILFIVLSFLVSVFLVVFRFNTLNLPFYWDEAWVYGPAIRKMGEDFCLLPSCSSEYTRGHPLFFHALGGLWVKIFGDSLFAVHAFALSITLSLQWSCFYIGSKLFNPVIGFFISVAVIVQNLVFAQASSVFPELLLAVFSLWTFFFYYRQRMWLYVVFGTLTCLIKEHGVILIAAIVFWDLIFKLKTSKISALLNSGSFRNFILLILPVIGLAVFFVVQRIQKGYFFFPEHLDLIRSGSQDVVYQLRIASRQLFNDSGRIVYGIFFLAVYSLFARNYPVYLRVLVPVLIFCMVKIVSGKWGFDDWLLLSTSFIITAFLIFSFILYPKKVLEIQSVFGVPAIFIVFYLVFSAFNFYTDRYLACLVPFMMFWIIGATGIYLEGKIFIATAGIALSAVSVFALITYNGYGDISPKNYEAIQVQRDVTRYMLNNNMQQQKIYTTFVMANNLKNADAGFVAKDSVFRKVNYGCNGNADADLIVLFSFDMDSCLVNEVRKKYRMNKQFRQGNAIGSIYSRSNDQ